VGRQSNFVSIIVTLSIVLVCRLRDAAAPVTTRRDFVSALKRELPTALKSLQHGNIAPVDLAQAAVGPGMGIFSRYSRVLEADGSTMRVRTALGLINHALAEVLGEQETDYDPSTRWAVAWFDQFGMAEGPYGIAETLSTAKDISISNLSFVRARAGKVRLLEPRELEDGWSPASVERLTVWEVAQHLIRTLEAEGEQQAAVLARTVGSVGEIARDLAYRLYATCERKGWAQQGVAYNSLVLAWPEIMRLAASTDSARARQTSYLQEA